MSTYFVGHVLEIVRPGERVSWDNAAGGVSYILVPGTGRRESAATWRDFTVVAARTGEVDPQGGGVPDRAGRPENHVTVRRASSARIPVSL